MLLLHWGNKTKTGCLCLFQMLVSCCCSGALKSFISSQGVRGFCLLFILFFIYRIPQTSLKLPVLPVQPLKGWNYRCLLLRPALKASILLYFIVIFKIIVHVCVHVCVHKYADVIAHAWSSEDSFQSWFSSAVGSSFQLTCQACMASLFTR